MIKEWTTSILAILIVAGAIASLFYPELNEMGSRLLQSLATLVIGFYFGGKSLPFAGLKIGGKKKKK